MALLLGASGCAGGVWAVEHDVVYVDDEPPEPVAEVVPSSPNPVFIWVPGYWYWSGRRYIWARGYWRRPPVPGHIWVGGGWVRHNGRYRYVPGRWANPRRAPRYRYHRQRPPAQQRRRPGPRPRSPTHRGR